MSSTPMVVYEQWHDGGFMVSEANGHRSRDQVTLSGGTKVLAGTVLGMVTAGGAFAPLNPAGSDGTQNAAGILWGTKDVTAAPAPATVVTRSCEVNASELIWPAGATPAQITAATQQLTALGIILR
ncbi:head decoration protein [Paraburkholderia sp. HD33-4]|uniref:head decoration protein n=1 Tax=Paraburkholderia sp. HD33-4 TaxID=2883242 RepID=UPI001F3A5D18|nr:head decoration protein [Paraburkholderia sp. HD33-4]